MLSTSSLQPLNDCILPYDTVALFCLSLNELQEQKTQAKARKWSTSLDELPSIDLRAAVPHPDISRIMWRVGALTKIQRSDKGSEGLFFVEALNNEVFIVKRSSSISSEVFCTLLALKMGFNCPKVTCI